jgi:hypothetical protein
MTAPDFALTRGLSWLEFCILDALLVSPSPSLLKGRHSTGRRGHQQTRSHPSPVEHLVVKTANTQQIVFIPVAGFIHDVYFHPLAGYPGPLLYRGSNIPKVVQQMEGDLTTKMHELHQIYGPVVRCAPNELSFITA